MLHPPLQAPGVPPEHVAAKAKFLTKEIPFTLYEEKVIPNSNTNIGITTKRRFFHDHDITPIDVVVHNSTRKYRLVYKLHFYKLPLCQ